MVDINKWKDSDINVDSLWLIDKRDSSGKHTNTYHGNFIPQIPYQLISRYTNAKDIVLELFTGGGTTLFECEKLKRYYIGFDINKEIMMDIKKKMQGTKIPYIINNCDVVDINKFEKCMANSLAKFKRKKVDFLIAHPPYLDIIKFTSLKEDLSNVSNINVFIEKLMIAFDNALTYLERGKYFAIVMGDIYKNSEVIPLGFYTMNAIKNTFNVKLKGVIVKNIEGNKGKLGSQGIWKYRALKSDYFIFKHEYIFVFKKEY